MNLGDLNTIEEVREMLLKEIYRIYHIIWGKENTG